MTSILGPVRSGGSGVRAGIAQPAARAMTRATIGQCSDLMASPFVRRSPQGSVRRSPQGSPVGAEEERGRRCPRRASSRYNARAMATAARSLEGKVAIITGAATGIGRATARLFAGAGARLTLADVRPAELEATAAEIRGSGGEVTAVVADLARPQDCAAVVEGAVGAHGRLDVLFNNAGVGTMVVGGTVETIPLERWDLAQDVNVRAIYLVRRPAVPHA